MFCRSGPPGPPGPPGGQGMPGRDGRDGRDCPSAGSTVIPPPGPDPCPTSSMPPMAQPVPAGYVHLLRCFKSLYGKGDISLYI